MAANRVRGHYNPVVQNMKPPYQQRLSMLGHVILGATVGGLGPWTISVVVSAVGHLDVAERFGIGDVLIGIALRSVLFPQPELVGVCLFGATMGALFSYWGFSEAQRATPRILVVLTTALALVLVPLGSCVLLAIAGFDLGIDAFWLDS